LVKLGLNKKKKPNLVFDRGKKLAAQKKKKGNSMGGGGGANRGGVATGKGE